MKDHVRTFEGPLGDLWGTFEGREVAFLVGSSSSGIMIYLVFRMKLQMVHLELNLES